MLNEHACSQKALEYAVLCCGSITYGHHGTHTDTCANSVSVMTRECVNNLRHVSKKPQFEFYIDRYGIFSFEKIRTHFPHLVNNHFFYFKVWLNSRQWKCADSVMHNTENRIIMMPTFCDNDNMRMMKLPSRQLSVCNLLPRLCEVITTPGPSIWLQQATSPLTG